MCLLIPEKYENSLNVIETQQAIKDLKDFFENRLGELKTELAAIDRKILLSIAPERKEQEVTIKINDIQEKPSLRLRAI